MLVDFLNYSNVGIRKKWLITRMKNFPPYLNFVATLPCKTNTSVTVQGRTCTSCVEVLHRKTPDFISPDLWPPNSPDINPVDYKIWAVMQRRVYQRKIHTIYELKQRLIEVWCGLEQSIVDMAIDQWRKRLRACVREKGGHFEHSLWTYCLDFVNFLSPSLSCFAWILHRWAQQHIVVKVHIHTSVSFTR